MRKLVLTVLMLALATSVALAQTTTGSIYGTVTTPDGLAIANVSVTLSSGHFATQTTTTNDRGAFRFGELPIGEYTLTFEKDGYESVVSEGVPVRLGLASRIEIAMETSEIERVITITGETALVDLRETGTSVQMTQEHLANIPTARDPWVIMDQVAGVNLDRFNVGGNESGQQSGIVSRGDQWDNTMWILDGVNISDPAALGGTPTYWDFDMFEEMQITTGGADATIQTGGLALNFITKQGSDTLHGQARYYFTDEQFQGSNLPAELEDIGYPGNSIASVKDYGFDVGGPIIPGKLWFWGSYGVQDITLTTVAGDPDTTKLENFNLKITGQLGNRHRWTFYAFRGEKIKSGRGASATRPPDTTWDQGGPTHVVKIEDSFIVSDNLILTGKFVFVPGEFHLYPKGGAVPVTLDTTNGMWGGSYFFYETERPQHHFTLRGEYFVDEAFGGSHEITAGFEYKRTGVYSISGWPAGSLHILLDPATDFYILELDSLSANDHTTFRNSFFLMDIFSAGRWTFNLGVRYDRQWGRNNASSVNANPAWPSGLPAIDYGGGSGYFTFNDFVPRLGMTYDLFGDGSTIVRANFSIYANLLGIDELYYMNPTKNRWADFLWEDDGDGIPEASELVGPIGANYDYTGDPLDPGYTMASDYHAPRTTEIIVGVERELMPDLSLSANYIWRRYTDTRMEEMVTGNFLPPEDGWSAADWYPVTVVQGGYELTYYDSTKEHTNRYTVMNWPDYQRRYWSIEMILTKRLSNNWMATAAFDYHNLTQHFLSSAAYIDPTNVAMWDGRYYAEEAAGSGKAELWMGAQWAFKASAMYQFPLGINVAGYFQMRQGYVLPLCGYVVREEGSEVYPLAVPFGEERLPSPKMLDLRVEKTWSIADRARIGVMMDIFNVFNANTTLRQVRYVNQTNFGEIEEIISPRVLRFGLRLNF